MRTFRYQIRFGWRGRRESPSALSKRYLDTLDDLVETLPDFFQPWHILDVRTRREIPFARARHVMTQVVKNNTDDDEEPEPVRGYHILSANRLENTPRTLEFLVDGGSKIYNEACLAIGSVDVPSDLSMVTFDFFEPAMRIIARHWAVDRACAQLYASDYEISPPKPRIPIFPGKIDTHDEPKIALPLGISPIPSSVFHIPWFAYLAAPFAKGIVLSPNMPARVVPGGLMIVPMEEWLDPTNPVHMRRAHELWRIMLEKTRGAPPA